MKYLKTTCVMCKGKGTLWEVYEDDQPIQTPCDFCEGTGGHGLQPLTDEEAERFRLRGDVVEDSEEVE